VGTSIKQFFAPSRFRVQEHRNISVCVRYYFLHIIFDCLHSASAFFFLLLLLLLFTYNTLDRHYTKYVISGIVISWPRPHQRVRPHAKHCKAMAIIYYNIIIIISYGGRVILFSSLRFTTIIIILYNNILLLLLLLCRVRRLILLFPDGRRILRNFYVLYYNVIRDIIMYTEENDQWRV